MELANVKKFYDTQVQRKLNDFIDTNARIDAAWNGLMSLIYFHDPQEILEIGCGIGNISWQLSKTFPQAAVTGFDISEKSVEIADKIFKESNLNFICANNLSETISLKNKKYDLIILMDVYEHIATEERKSLHYFFKEHISPNGIIFLSCPTPKCLDFLRKNKSSEIQPIDEDINISDLIALSSESSIHLFYYREIDIWFAGDYFHAAFNNNSNVKKSNKKIKNKKKRSVKMLSNKIKSRFDKNYFKKIQIRERKVRLQMVVKALGDTLKIEDNAG